MELQFRKETCPYLETVLQQVQNREETQEIRLNEGMPDIGRILAAWGQPVLRSKEWRSREIILSGGVMVWILYAPEDGTQSRCLEGWIPFQMEWDLPENVEEGNIRVSLLPRFTDARSISARKILVRTGIAAQIQALCPKEAQVYVPGSENPEMEWLIHTYPMQLPREAGEKTFVIDEELTLPPSAPEGEKLLYYRFVPSTTDQKILADRLVFRGTGKLHVLCASEEGQLFSWDFEIPISQFAQLHQEYSADSGADVLLCPTNVEAELDDEGNFRVKCGIAAQYLVQDQQLVTLAEDAYCPGSTMVLETGSLQLPAVLETRIDTLWGELAVPSEALAVPDVQFLPDFPRQRQTEQGIALEYPGTVQMLYYAEDGALQSASVRWEGRQELPGDKENEISVWLRGGLAEMQPGSGNVKLEVPLAMTVTGTRGLAMITGAEVGEKQLPDPQEPSLILRRAGDGGLWNLAKVCGSTRSAIQKANGLEGEPDPDRVLLIPVG